jgi:hypothetical protein
VQAYRTPVREALCGVLDAVRVGDDAAVRALLTGVTRRADVSPPLRPDGVPRPVGETAACPAQAAAPSLAGLSAETGRPGPAITFGASTHA